jgi:hypothetical protein
MNYQTVFEIGLRSFPWGSLLRPVPFIFAGLILFRFGRSKRVYQVTGIIVAAMAILFFFLAALVLLPEFIETRHAYRSGDSSVVQGIVENYHSAPALGPARESFSVSGVNFSYNALDATPCFHNAPFRHGPVSAGLSVRITYNNQCIQRLESFISSQ